MTHEFEIREEIALPATPEQVWEAIATGPGVDSWFLGRTEIEPNVGGATRLTLAGFTQEGTVTAWEPYRRLAYQGKENADGTFMAFEYLIEAREGATVLRFVHSGILGDGWEDEYDAVAKGDPIYLKKLAVYLEHFPGRTTTYAMFAAGPQVADAERVWAAFLSALDRTGTVSRGDHVRLAAGGLDPAEGVVEFVAYPNFLGVRTKDAIYNLIHGHRDLVAVEYHGFSADVDGERIRRSWQTWLDTLTG